MLIGNAYNPRSQVTPPSAGKAKQLECPLRTTGLCELLPRETLPQYENCTIGEPCPNCLNCHTQHGSHWRTGPLLRSGGAKMSMPGLCVVS
ncbi:hypothetical protein MMON_37150 [Mycolicibacterium monacense]|uniref:Uncharacterized protein n=1 Tax=Mycolicibacterium monacense TaxID=85693 RepID=A0AAD1IXJ5_MYCMB|nr:hypothetical protein MMON_37150 [Mycolicibacterium monacense]